MGRLTPIFTSRKLLNITYQSPSETLLPTPETLPTTEPATPQVGYIVGSGDLPAFGLSVYPKVWVALIFGAGKFVTAGTLSWRMKKNGSSVNTGTASVAANTFYTVNPRFYDIAVGDVLEIALWSNQTDSNYDYKAYQIQASRIIVMGKIRLLCPCNFSGVTPAPVLTQGNPSLSEQWGFYPYHCDTIILLNISSAKTFESLYAKDTYGILRLYYADYNTPNNAQVLTNATYRPRYNRNFVPTQIVCRGLII